MEQVALRICRETFECVVRKDDVPPLPTRIPEELSRPMCGVYIAVFEKPGKQPRGYVGSPFPTKPSLAEEIQTQVVRLARTYPFRKEDLLYLEYEVLITGPSQFLPDIEGLSPDVGLLIRDCEGKWATSLPSERKKDPHVRFQEAVSSGKIKESGKNDLRLYQFTVEVIRES